MAKITAQKYLLLSLFARKYELELCAIKQDRTISQNRSLSVRGVYLPDRGLVAKYFLIMSDEKKVEATNATPTPDTQSKDAAKPVADEQKKA